jgi:hypothetical protein
MQNLFFVFVFFEIPRMLAGAPAAGSELQADNRDRAGAGPTQPLPPRPPGGAHDARKWHPRLYISVGGHS